MKIYTRSGDDGETSLLAGERVRKDDFRIEAIGSVDELNASIGVVRAELARGGGLPASMDSDLDRMQHRLFDLGAELAGVSADAGGGLSEPEVAAIESAIDGYEATLEPLREFILPGGTNVAAQLHVARCACRRCERRLVELA